MSTLKTTNLQHASAASPAIVLAADGSATAQLSSINGGPLAGSRNRIINGDMRIDQRNAGASVNTNGSYPVDRFRQDFAGGGVITAQRSTTAPAGFTNSVSLTVSTADSSIAAGDYYLLQHRIEGFNTADFGFGAAGAATVTMSFWARSSVTGTFGGGFHNDNDTRAYVFTYTVNAANTWEYKTISIAGDTTGTWNTGNATGASIIFDLGSGSNYNGTAGSWAGSNLFRTSGCVNWIANSGATFYITGVQLEAGTVATPFERIDYSESLRRCQRYYEVGTVKMFAGGVSSPVVIFQNYRAFKRSAATLAYSTPGAGGYNPPSSLEFSDVTGFQPNSGTQTALQFFWTATAEL